jgi:SAM-dependent methyltransferase
MSTPIQSPAPKPRPGAQSASPFVRKCLRSIGSLERTGPNSTLAIDVPSGYGRHAYLLIEQGYDVIAIDADESTLKHARLGVPSGNHSITCIVADCLTDVPLAPDTMCLAVVVHFISSTLLQALSRLLRTGGYLVYETYGGNGGNYLTLPYPGQIAAALYPYFELISYQEKPVGPSKQAVTVKCLARRVTVPLDNRPIGARV